VLGRRIGDDATRPVLIALLNDPEPEVRREVAQALVNFDPKRVLELVHEGLDLKAGLLEKHEPILAGLDHPMALWRPASEAALRQQAYEVGVLFSNPDEDTRSLRETVIYGLKGIAAYQYHAMILGHDDPELTPFIVKALAATTRELTVAELLELALETGRVTIVSMALIDRANTETYGEPEITRIPLGVRGNPGILVTGHDLKDMQELLEQTEGTGVDVYTHSEMLATHYYPAFKKFKHLAGNYGNAWWNQDRDFATFNGPIVVTSNCITPVQDAYRNRIFSTGPVAYPGVPHIEEDASGRKDWSQVIALARQCPAPQAVDAGEFVGGFGRAQLDAAAGRIAEPGKSGGSSSSAAATGGTSPGTTTARWRSCSPRTPSSSPPAAPSTASCSASWGTSRACPGSSTRASATTATLW